jgi:O-antigen/teichoic acid export membrane protein
MTSENIPTLKQRLLRSSLWTLAGYGANQALRLGGNLILTRLLFPEAFGMMAIIQAVIYGVWMLTDVGIGPSIVQKARGNEPDFLNTAWTVQIVRGFIIWLGLCMLAWPLARLYGEPALFAMLLVVGLSSVISGFNSTKLFTAQRNIEAARVSQIDVATYAIGLIGTIVLAWQLQTVWSLVWGSLITTFLKMLASHFMLHGIRNQFCWERDALNHLVGFGRWILLSSALTFLSVEGARLLIGAVLDMRQVALFTLASTLNLMLWQVIQHLAGNIFFPVYAEVHRSDPNKLRALLFKVRLMLIVPSWLLAFLFVFQGSALMELLYDERYHASGVMLEWLAVGSLVECIWRSYYGVLLALGKVATMTMLTAINVVLQFSGIYVGFHYGGELGVVIGISLSIWAMYPLQAYAMARNGLWQPRLDVLFLAASMLVVQMAWTGLHQG